VTSSSPPTRSMPNDYAGLSIPRRSPSRLCAPRSKPLPRPLDDQAGDRPRIFLACVSEAQGDLRERLITEIGDRAQIPEKIPPPWEHESYAQAVAATLGGADLSIHLLGEWPGPKIKDHWETSYPREQAEIAMARAVKQFIWLPEDLSIEEVEDPPYREWLRELESGPRKKPGIELVRGSTQTLIDLVLDRIATLRGCLETPSQQII